MPERSNMVQFVYDAELLQRFRDVLVRTRSGIVPQLQNLTWLWKSTVQGRRITDLLSDNFQLVWQEGQAQWARPTDAYLMQKTKRGYSPLTLVRTGRLYDALTNPGGTPDTISFGDAQNYYYGINAEAFRDAGGWSYPEIHNHLGDRRGNVRPFMHFHPVVREKVNQWLWLGIKDMVMGAARSIGKGVNVT